MFGVCFCSSLSPRGGRLMQGNASAVRGTQCSYSTQTSINAAERAAKRCPVGSFGGALGFVACMDAGQGREQDAVASLVAHIESLCHAPRFAPKTPPPRGGRNEQNLITKRQHALPLPPARCRPGPAECPPLAGLARSPAPASQTAGCGLELYCGTAISR